MRAQTLESCAWESVARGTRAGWSGVGSGPARSQWRMAPSEPPETRIGWTGCQVTAVVVEGRRECQ